MAHHATSRLPNTNLQTAITMENNNPNPKRSLSQKARILKYLEAGNTLTPLDAWRLIGTSKLATRVSELIAEGHTEIQKRRVEVITADGDTARVMSYSIAEPKLKLAYE